VKQILAILCAVAVGTSAGCGRLRVSDEATPSPTETALRALLAEATPPGFVTPDKEGARLWKLTREFYQRHSHRSAWIDEKHPTAQMDALIRALEAADQDGLDPEIYSLSTLKARREEAAKGFLRKKGFEPGQAGQLEVFLTYLYMKYASDLADGISDLAHADPAWKIESERFEPLDHLERALAENRIAESLRDLTPQAPQYNRLRAALADYRKKAAEGGWPAVPRNLKVKPGEKGQNVGLLARRLSASGDYPGSVPDGGVAAFDDALVDALKRFQRRHGLQDDGKLGPGVIAAMNVPIEQRIEQIRLNLERWRWLPRDLGQRHILVNLPAFQLDVWEGDRVPLSMKVVVGKKDTPTPIFNDKMTHLVFSPYWNVPPSIASGETLPAVMADAAFLDRNNMEVLDSAGNRVDPASIDLSDPQKYRFRQRPGSGNSLGLVKFMFPNQFNVYLHDTPADSLFARATRSFSHGCVRIEQPQALAEYLLREQPDWSKDRIVEAMNAGEEKTVKLTNPVPVYLGYWTTAATPDGLQFVGDLYGIDRRQTVLVADRAMRLKKSSEVAVATSGTVKKPLNSKKKEKKS
jgi:murein L,D-transpeptidase YcbB/YkuD